MEKGKMYKNKFNGTIVLCIEDTTYTNGYSKGVVIERGEEVNSIGDILDKLDCKYYEEFLPKKILVKNEIYDVPEGCKAEIKDNKIIVKDDIKYYKIEGSDCTSYIREYLDKQLNIYIYKDGYTYVITDVKIMVEGEKSHRGRIY